MYTFNDACSPSLVGACVKKLVVNSCSVFHDFHSRMNAVSSCVEQYKDSRTATYNVPPEEQASVIYFFVPTQHG